jgi:hypothetical protein
MHLILFRSCDRFVEIRLLFHRDVFLCWHLEAVAQGGHCVVGISLLHCPQHISHAIPWAIGIGASQALCHSHWLGSSNLTLVR